MKDSYIFYKDRLGKEYLAVFDQVELYVSSQNVDESAMEERLGELLDIFLSTEEAGRPVQSIVGNDVERFCKTFCEDFGWKNSLLSVVDRFKSISWLLLVLSFLDMTIFIEDTLESGGGDFWKGASSVNLSGYMIGILAAWAFGMVFNAVLSRMMFKMKKISMKILRAASYGGAVLGFFIVSWFLSQDESALFSCPAWVVFVGSVVYLVFYYPLRGWKIRRQKVKFLDLVGVEVEKELPDEMEKRFARARKKSLKKGKGELYLEAFLAKEEKDCDKTERTKLFYYLTPLVITGMTFVLTYQVDGFDGIVDMLIFVALLLVVEYSIMLGFWKIAQIGVKRRRAWIEMKREELARGNSKLRAESLMETEAEKEEIRYKEEE